jgi:hypothetical protein
VGVGSPPILSIIWTAPIPSKTIYFFHVPNLGEDFALRTGAEENMCTDAA